MVGEDDFPAVFELLRVDWMLLLYFLGCFVAEAA